MVGPCLERLGMDRFAKLGSTDLEVSRHGFGAARIGDGAPLDQIENLFDSLLDLGITFVDTADCCARSERDRRRLKRRLLEPLFRLKLLANIPFHSDEVDPLQELRLQ